MQDLVGGLVLTSCLLLTVKTQTERGDKRLSNVVTTLLVHGQLTQPRFRLVEDFLCV